VEEEEEEEEGTEIPGVHFIIQILPSEILWIRRAQGLDSFLNRCASVSGSSAAYCDYSTRVRDYFPQNNLHPSSSIVKILRASSSSQPGIFLAEQMQMHGQRNE
jgi:hypothetical protein